MQQTHRLPSSSLSQYLRFPQASCGHAPCGHAQAGNAAAAVMQLNWQSIVIKTTVAVQTSEIHVIWAVDVEAITTAASRLMQQGTHARACGHVAIHVYASMGFLQ